MRQTKVTESIYIIRMMLKAGTVAGVDANIARESIHLDQSILDDPDARVPMAMEEALWEVLAERSGDKTFGLHAALTLEPGEFDVMDYAIRSSVNLRQAMENARRYNRLLHDVAEFELTEEGQIARFDHFFRDDPKGANWHAGDFTLASIYAMSRVITGNNWSPRRVCFQHAEPPDRSAYKAVFPCTLEFDCPRNRLEFDATVLNYPVIGSDPALHRVLTRHADEMLSNLPASDDVIEQVRNQVSAYLRKGDPNIERIAEKLHLTPRTLQRRLKESGTTYKDVVDGLRKALSDRYLKESHFGVSEIAYLLGYSEPSAFHRAFKRWFGESPASFRQHRSVG